MQHHVRMMDIHLQLPGKCAKQLLSHQRVHLHGAHRILFVRSSRMNLKGKCVRIRKNLLSRRPGASLCRSKAIRLRHIANRVLCDDVRIGNRRLQHLADPHQAEHLLQRFHCLIRIKAVIVPLHIDIDTALFLADLIFPFHL